MPDFEITTLEAVSLGGLQRRLPFATRQALIPEMFDDLSALIRAAGLMVAAPEIAVYRMLGAEEIEVTLGVEMPILMAGFARFELPRTRALRTRHIGPFSGLAALYPALYGEIEARGLRPAGASREVYKLVAKNAEMNLCDVYAYIE